MAYPVVESVTETSFSSASTNHAVSMPATVNVGDLLLVLFMCGPFLGAADITTPADWTQKWHTKTAGFGAFGGYVKVADGTEDGTTVNFSTNNSVTGVAQCFRISTWYGQLAGIESGTAVTSGGSSNPDPPSLTASWGTDDNLWIACFGGADDDATVSSYPFLFSNGVDTISGAGANAGCEIGSARVEVTLATLNPATFTLGDSEAWIAQTVVVASATAFTTSTTSSSTSTTTSSTSSSSSTSTSTTTSTSTSSSSSTSSSTSTSTTTGPAQKVKMFGEIDKAVYIMGGEAYGSHRHPSRA